MFSAPIIYDYLTNAMRASSGRQASDPLPAVRSRMNLPLQSVLSDGERPMPHSLPCRPGLMGRLKVLYICSRPDGIFPGWKQPSEPLEKEGCIATGR